MFNKKLIFQAGEGGLIILIILTLLSGSALLYRKTTNKIAKTRKTTNQSPQSIQGVPALSFAADPLTIGSGDNFNLILKINPNGSEFHAFELYANFDSQQVEPQDKVNLANNITSSYSLIISNLDLVNNQISIVGTRTGSAFSGSQDIEVARIRLKKKSGVTGNLTFTWGEKTKLGNKLQLQKLNAEF